MHKQTMDSPPDEPVHEALADMLDESLSLLTHRSSIGIDLADKMNPEHLSKLLKIAGDENRNTYRLSIARLWFTGGYILMGVGLLVFSMVFLLPDHKAMLGDILKFLGGAASGFGLGWGLRSKKDA